MVYVRRTTTVRKRYYRRPRYSRRRRYAGRTSRYYRRRGYLRRYKRRFRKTGKRSAYISPKTAEKLANLDKLWSENIDSTDSDTAKYGTAVNILASYLNIMHKMNRWIIRYRRRKNWIFLIFNSILDLTRGINITWPAELLPRNYVEIRKLAALLSNPPTATSGTTTWQQSVKPYFNTTKLLAAILYKGLNYNQLETCINALSGVDTTIAPTKLVTAISLGNAAKIYIQHSIRRYAITPLISGGT